MPKATVSTELHHRDLKALPEGFVKLKQLSFDQMLERRDKAMKMTMDSTTGDRARPTSSKIEMESAMQWTRFFEFSNCIVEHNLEDDNGAPLNFNNPMTLKILDPKVGQEIERYIEELNQEDEESLEDFTKQLSASSRDSENTLNGDTVPS
jgi:hypothetical protein